MKRIVSGAVVFLILLPLCAAPLSGCGKIPQYVNIPNPGEIASAQRAQNITLIDISAELVPLTEDPAIFSIPMPSAPGTNAKNNDRAVIDYSNQQDGYVMVQYLKQTSKALRVIVKGPTGTSYTYTLKSDGSYEVYPLSDGNGTYQIGVYENVEGNKYATACSATVDVSLTDEFAPFLRPNQYVNYTPQSSAVQEAAALVNGSADFMGKVSSIYNYVINALTYDKELAANVKSGYLPDIDLILAKGKGICFDYSAVMTAMLRSQGIPCKLVVGYTGNMYHAWIDVYAEGQGWINNLIYLDGVNWKLMDPTFASTSNQDKATMDYINNSDNYTPKYLY